MLPRSASENACDTRSRAMRPSLSIVAQMGVICECAVVTVPIACEQSHNCSHDEDHHGNRDVDGRRRTFARKIHVITL